MRVAAMAIVLALTWAMSMPVKAADSRCFGTASHGRLEDGTQIPESGPNFTPYSTLGVTLGRTYVHSTIAAVIAEAYSTLAVTDPQFHYVYGESGWASGGRIRPHRTHQNGTAVDFMVPVRDESGHSVPLPTNIHNKFGYGIEFDAQARYGNLAIDFEALAEHLYALSQAAHRHRIGISRVIFEKPYIPRLYSTRRGEFIRSSIPFMQGEPWIRHDEHYHVDFAIPCAPLQ